jgi:hypothetical protein
VPFPVLSAVLGAALTESRDPSTRKAKIEMYQIGG